MQTHKLLVSTYVFIWSFLSVATMCVLSVYEHCFYCNDFEITVCANLQMSPQMCQTQQFLLQL